MTIEEIAGEVVAEYSQERNTLLAVVRAAEKIDAENMRQVGGNVMGLYSVLAYDLHQAIAALPASVRAALEQTP